MQERGSGRMAGLLRRAKVAGLAALFLLAAIAFALGIYASMH